VEALKASVGTLRACVRLFWQTSGMRTRSRVICERWTTKLSDPPVPSAA
jgi:hypothetical protein